MSLLIVFEGLCKNFPTDLPIRFYENEDTNRSRAEIVLDSHAEIHLHKVEDRGLAMYSLLHEYAHIMTFDQFEEGKGTHDISFFVNLLRVVIWYYVEPDKYPWNLEYDTIRRLAIRFKIWKPLTNESKSSLVFDG